MMLPLSDEERYAAKKAVCEKGTVFAPKCSGLFDAYYEIETIDLSNADMSLVTDMEAMFSSDSGLTSLDLTSFDTFAVTSMKRMFSKCGALETILVSDDWTAENVTDSENMFLDCTAVTGGSGTVYDAEHTDAEYARIDTAGTPGYLTGSASQGPVMGDVNGDGLFNAADAVCMVKWLIHEPDAKLKIWTNGDFNSDSRLDARDLTEMKRALMQAMHTATMTVTSRKDSGKVFTTEFTVKAGDVFFESEEGIWRQNAREETAPKLWNGRMPTVRRAKRSTAPNTSSSMTATITPIISPLQQIHNAKREPADGSLFLY